MLYTSWSIRENSGLLSGSYWRPRKKNYWSLRFEPWTKIGFCPRQGTTLKNYTSIQQKELMMLMTRIQKYNCELVYLFYLKWISNARALKGVCASARIRKARISLIGGMRMPTNLYYRPIGTYDDPIIPNVLTTLDVIIGRANIGTILDRRKSFLLARRFSTLLHNVWCTT